MQIALKTPIQTHAGPTKVLNLREPTGADFIQLKSLPFKVKGVAPNIEIDIDFALSAKWLSALSGIDELLIGKMTRGDFITAIGSMNELLVAEGADAGN